MTEKSVTSEAMRVARESQGKNTAIKEIAERLGELEDILDQQIYPEQVKDDFDAPNDREYSITLTAKQYRRFGEAVRVAENEANKPAESDRSFPGYREPLKDSAGVSPGSASSGNMAETAHRPQERGISAEAPGYREMREALGITGEDVYLALKGQLDHSMAYIDNDPEVTNLSSITVDGIVDCEDMADFLNRKRAALDKART